MKIKIGLFIIFAAIMYGFKVYAFASMPSQDKEPQQIQQVQQQIQQGQQLLQIQEVQQQLNNLKNNLNNETMQNVNLALQGANRATSLVSAFALIFTSFTVILGFFGFKELASIRKVRLDAENNLKLTMHFSAGTTYVNAGIVVEAIKEFLQVLEIDKNNIAANTQLGWLFASAQPPDQSKSKFYSRRAIELNPNNYIAYLNLGVAMDHSGESKKDVLSTYLKGEEVALREGADDITLGKFILFAGHSYKHLGDKGNAKSKYDQARVLFQKHASNSVPQIADGAKRWLKELEDNYTAVSTP
jgi:tetratricopeptide (TPR) repeat protein